MGRKFAALLISAALVSGQATAGGMAEPIMEEQVEEQAAAGSRAGILVPILALILIGLAMSNDNDRPNGQELVRSQ